MFRCRSTKVRYSHDSNRYEPEVRRCVVFRNLYSSEIIGRLGLLYSDEDDTDCRAKDVSQSDDVTGVWRK